MMKRTEFPRGTEIEPVREEEPDNTCTRISVVDGGIFDGPGLGGVVALRRYESALRSVHSAASKDSVFVAVCDGRGNATKAVIMRPGSATIIGRHTEADLRIQSPDVSLRHIAVAVASNSVAENPLVRVFDLATQRPFETEDGVAAEAVTASGPCFLTLGSLYIAIIPLGTLPAELPMGTKSLWKAMPERKFVSRIAGGDESAASNDNSPAISGAIVADVADELSVSMRPATRISRMQGPVNVDQVGCSLEDATGTIWIRGEEGRGKRVHLDEEALSRGLLLGRYDRCLGRFRSEWISRVHLLIARVGDSIMAIDTASTHGSSRAESGYFRSIDIGKSAIMELADDAVVVWQSQDA